MRRFRASSAPTSILSPSTADVAALYGLGAELEVTGVRRPVVLPPLCVAADPVLPSPRPLVLIGAIAVEY